MSCHIADNIKHAYNNIPSLASIFIYYIACMNITLPYHCVLITAQCILKNEQEALSQVLFMCCHCYLYFANICKLHMRRFIFSSLQYKKKKSYFWNQRKQQKYKVPKHIRRDEKKLWFHFSLEKSRVLYLSTLSFKDYLKYQNLLEIKVRFFFFLI